MLVFLCLFATISLIDGLGLPEGLKACKADSTFNECSLKHGQAAISYLIKGNPKYGVPVMDPMFIKRIRVIESSNKNAQMNITFNNMNMYGLKDSTFLKSDWDFKNMKVEWNLKTPLLKLVSDYTMKGRFLVVQLNGDGKAAVTIENLNFSYIFEYRVIKKKGVEYMDIIGTPKLMFTTTKVHFNLENIIKGDKFLSQATNEMLNENWVTLNDAIGPAIGNGIAEEFTQIFRSITKVVPYSEVIAQ